MHQVLALLEVEPGGIVISLALMNMGPSAVRHMWKIQFSWNSNENIDITDYRSRSAKPASFLLQ